MIEDPFAPLSENAPVLTEATTVPLPANALFGASAESLGILAALLGSTPAPKDFVYGLLFVFSIE
jgi:hypothetical protein